MQTAPARFAEAMTRQVPRYTSYPTAVQFSSAVGPEDYARWLADIQPDASLSLYLHVPFCAQLCWYCACHTRVVNGYDSIARYRDALAAEIAGVRRAIGRRADIRHIHWGGGTPTVLRAGDFRSLDAALRENFSVSTDAEIAVEIDPRRLDDDMVDALASAGVTRVSFGVQDFDQDVQAAINRHQSFELTRDAVERLGSAGVRSVNIDLVYGLPRQTEPSIAATVRKTIELRPDRIALFGYAHVPWLKSHQRLIREAELPDASDRWAQMTAAAMLLTGAGYRAIGIDHFALPEDDLARAAAGGRLHRNFQGYTTDDAPYLIGFGASAISSLSRGYAQNTADVAAWLGRIEAGGLATARGIALSAEDRLRNELIERLMCDLSVDVATVARRHDVHGDVLSDALPALDHLAQTGIVQVEGSVVRVPQEARPLARLAAAAFDGYLRSDQGRHSAAV
jgi:oxygen-independent coproporphyrinogen-3 oxidase